MKFYKYEFTKVQWDSIKESIQVTNVLSSVTNVNWNTDLVASVVEIGFMPLVHQVLDAELNVITKAVYSKKYSVDILWQDDELPAFAQYKIWCNPLGIHSFGESIDEMYITEFNSK